MIKLEAGTSATFRINGKPYQKGAYEVILYGSKVGVKNTHDKNDVISPQLFSEWTNSLNVPYASLQALLTEIETLFFLDGSGSGAIYFGYKYTANNYTDLTVNVAPSPSDPAGVLAYVYNSQGTAWLPGSLGGTYYPKGAYLWTGSTWTSDRNEIAAAIQDIYVNKENTGVAATLVNNHTAAADPHPQYALDSDIKNPGGLNKQIQFNNSGIFGGTNKLLIDINGSLLLVNTDLQAPESDPSFDAAALKFYAGTSYGRKIPVFKSANDHLFEPQESWGTTDITYITANAGTNTLTVIGQTITSIGTVTTRVQSITNVFQSSQRVGFVSAVGAGSSAGTRIAVGQFTRGNAAGIGGFVFYARFGISQGIAGMRMFVGLRAITTAIPNVDPSTLVNIIGIAADISDTNLQIMVNDAAGTATKTNLGASFPKNTSNTDLYDLRIYCAANSSQVFIELINLSSGQSTRTSINSDLPDNNIFLCPHVHINNGVTGAVVAIDLNHLYLQSKF